MRRFLFRTLVLSAFVIALSVLASAQDGRPVESDGSNIPAAIMKGTGKAAVVIIKSASKVG